MVCVAHSRGQDNLGDYCRLEKTGFLGSFPQNSEVFISGALRVLAGLPVRAKLAE
jgi:hypothetical protein